MTIYEASTTASHDVSNQPNALAAPFETEVGVSEELLDALYKKPIVSTRNGPIFNAHSYPTKINTTAIVPFILAHTKPGDVVFDGFAGTGATGLAVALCSNPEIQLQESVE